MRSIFNKILTECKVARLSLMTMIIVMIWFLVRHIALVPTLHITIVHVKLLILVNSARLFVIALIIIIIIFFIVALIVLELVTSIALILLLN